MSGDRDSRSEIRDGFVTSGGETPDGQVRRQLYRILSDPAQSLTGKIERLLQLGCTELGVENGHVVDIDREAGRHEIVAAAGSDLVEADSVTDLERTFCRETIDRDRILAVRDASADGWAEHPAAEAWDINCYIGSKLFVQREFFGTICFVDSGARDTSFSSDDRAVVDLLSQAVGRLFERRNHEQELQSEQEWFQLFVREVSDYALYMLDPAGYIVTWNAGARRLKQYEEDEILGEHLSRLYTGPDRGRGLPAQLLEEARQNGRAEDTGRRVRKDGSTFWAHVSITALYDDAGELRGFGKVTRDLSERRAAEQALREEQEFTERALDTLDDLFIVLTPAGEMERVNERALEVTGYSEAEILAMHPIEFFADEDRETIAQGIAEVLETGTSRVEATLVTNDAERLQYEFRVRTLTEDDGTVTGIVGIGRDISEGKLYEQRLEVAQRVLRHNLRNDMNVIRGMAENLHDDVTGIQLEAVERILRTADRLLERTEKTRMMTELDGASGKRRPVDVMHRLPKMLEEFRADSPEATIESDLPETDSLRLPVGDRFRTAVENAIENAVDHNDDPVPWVRVTVDEDPGQVHVRFEDDGPGIPAQQLRVLEEGTETQLSHGRGIGLWLIHWCMATVGGQIRFEDRNPRGSEITLSFPKADDS